MRRYHSHLLLVKLHLLLVKLKCVLLKIRIEILEFIVLKFRIFVLEIIDLYLISHTFWDYCTESIILYLLDFILRNLIRLLILILEFMIFVEKSWFVSSLLLLLVLKEFSLIEYYYSVIHVAIIRVNWLARSV